MRIPKELRNKILVTLMKKDKTQVENLVEIIQSEINVNGITYPIRTRGVFSIKATKQKNTYMIPNIMLSESDNVILALDSHHTGTAITDDNLFMRKFHFKV